MSKLHIYTVHVNPSLRQPYENAEFIEEGFSWKAFIFTFFWALYNRLWLAATLIVAADLMLIYLSESRSLTFSGHFILHACLHVVSGVFGNDWLRATFARQGYITADLVTGDSQLGAELRFFDRYFAVHHSANA